MATDPARKKRIAITAAVVLCAALVLASGIPNFVAHFFYAGIYQSLFPSTMSWDSHGAYVKCNGAIAGHASWPATPAAKCQAMSMCANEGAFSDSERNALSAHIRTSGCQEP